MGTLSMLTKNSSVGAPNSRVKIFSTTGQGRRSALSKSLLSLWYGFGRIAACTPMAWPSLMYLCRASAASPE